MKYYVALLLLVLAGCHSDNQATAGANATITPDSVATSVKTPVYSSIKEPAQVARGFFTWYKKNQMSVGYMNLVLNADAANSSEPYEVDFGATETYLDEINKSGFVSQAYLNTWKSYFKRQDDSLSQHPQTDGPPAGFEFDLVTHSQEPEIYLDNPQKAPQHTELIAPDRAIVRLNFTTQKEYPDYRVFYLSRSKSRWLIDSISVD